jgi:hypothetical protein
MVPTLLGIAATLHSDQGEFCKTISYDAIYHGKKHCRSNIGGNDYEKTLLPRLQKQSVVWVRNIKAQRPNAFADDVFHTIQHGSDRFERISKGYPCLMIIEGLMTLSV